MQKALRDACVSDNVQEVNRLLEKGANPCGPDANGWTFIMTAAAVGSTNCIRILQKAIQSNGQTSSINVTGSRMESPLYCLDTYALNIAESDAMSKGITALDLALKGNHRETAALLRTYGALCTGDILKKRPKNARKVTATMGKKLASCQEAHDNI